LSRDTDLISLKVSVVVQRSMCPLLLYSWFGSRHWSFLLAQAYSQVNIFLSIRPFLLTPQCLATAFSHFLKRRATFAKHLKKSDSALTTGRYFRLMSMAIVEMFFGLLVTSLNMWWTMRSGLRPWISWKNVHSNWLEVAYFPLAIIPPTELAWTFALWFMIPIASIFFFLFFAFGRDAVKEYGTTFTWIRRHVLRLPDGSSPGPYPPLTTPRYLFSLLSLLPICWHFWLDHATLNCLSSLRTSICATRKREFPPESLILHLLAIAT
jgi:hypothetical protein